ncbi:MAG: DUF3146 family protein [Leptolyngbya sp. LCM1.Bin17]|nr:MAG: DUF3146 family protein [Leptolyngbya sp. LCM1.Bin17]
MSPLRSELTLDFVHFLASVTTHRPQTTAYVRITHQSWTQGRIEGEVRANAYEWQFQWRFRQGHLQVEPSLGRALIREPLSRFLERFDYQLEPGGDYSFTIRAKL